MTDFEQAKTIDPAEDAAQNKGLALGMFLIPFLVVLALLMDDKKNSAFLRFWANQLIVYLLANIVLIFVNIIPILGQLVYCAAVVMMLVFWIIALVSINNGQCKPLPLIGEFKII